MGKSGEKWSRKIFFKIFLIQRKTTYNDSKPSKTSINVRKCTKKDLGTPKNKITDPPKSRFFDHTHIDLIGPKSRWPDLRRVMSVWANFLGGFLRWLEKL